MFRVEKGSTDRCRYCGREKDGISVAFDEGASFPDGHYCWADAKRIVQMMNPREQPTSLLDRNGS